MSSYDLGPLAGGRFHQYANSIGQVYYVDNITNTTSYSIPTGFDDRPGDPWALDESKSWPQWNNNRTGRAVLIDPNPPPLQTYLDDSNVQAALNLLVKLPDSPERVYRRPMVGILHFLFPPTDGYEVVQEIRGRPGFCILKHSPTPGGALHEFDFLLTESKKLNEPWGATEDQLRERLAENMNETKNCYGMIHIGLVVQFYKYEQGVFEKVGEKMHLLTDVHDVIRWAQYLKEHPMPVV